MKTLLAAIVLVGLGIGAAAAPSFGDDGTMSNQQGLENLMGRRQAEVQRLQLENQMRQMDLEDRRARVR